MAGPPERLEQLSLALLDGGRDPILSCFATDATLVVMSGEDRITLTGHRIGDAVDALLTGFDDLRLTPTSLHITNEGVVEEAVVSGDHTGIFGGAEPTGRRVCVNTRLSATWGPDSSLASLLVEADTRALFAQIAGTDDVSGVTGGLVAVVRERYNSALHVTDETSLPPLPVPSSRGTARPPASRRRWVLAMVVAAALLTGGLTWRSASSAADLEAAHTLTTASVRAPGKQSTGAVTPRPSHRAQPTTAPRPIIATANPKRAPTVQAGQQVVLKSDVLFALDSATLTPAAIARLGRLAKLVRDTNVTGTIQINGYTDNSGGFAYNSALSRSRALAVARVLQTELVGRHVTLVPQGFGQANPVAPNTSDAARARNRIVTVVLPVHR